MLVRKFIHVNGDGKVSSNWNLAPNVFTRLEDAAAYCGISKSILRRKIEVGEFRCRRTSDQPGAHYLITMEAPDEWLAGDDGSKS